MSNEAIAPVEDSRDNLPKATLWEIAESIAQILYTSAEELDEHSEESFAEMDAKLEKLDLQFNEKVDACIKAIKNRKAESDMIAEEIKKLRRMKQISDNNRQRLTNYVDDMMAKLNYTEAGTGLFKASVRRSPMTVNETDIHEVPEEFVEIVLKLKKREVIEHIKATGEIPTGVEWFQGHHLRIT